MAGLRVFVSSTCFDLGTQRAQVRSLLTRMGYEPVMSEHSDVLYDHRIHTHTSCIKEIVNADIVVLLIGPRFGGTAVPQALSEIDFQSISKSSTRADLVKDTDKLSITQVEIMKAIEVDIPLFAFVDSRVYSDYHLYQKNKSKSFANEIEYPSLEKADSAQYIFEFINLIIHRYSNNSIIPFAGFSDIENHLLKQWSMMFQRLIQEERGRSVEARRADTILEQIQDVKAAVLQSIEKTPAREVARSVVRFRRLADFLLALRLLDAAVSVEDYSANFEELLAEFGVLGVEYVGGAAATMPRTVLIREHDWLRVRIPGTRFAKFFQEWRSFSQLDKETKLAVLDGVADADAFGPQLVQVVPGQFDEAEQQNALLMSVDDAVRALTGDEPQVSTGWTEERLAVLKEMWADGATASQIAEALGGVSRNAVIGKAHRLGLKSRPAPFVGETANS